MPQTLMVVAHTHWDREWYLTQATFQMMNVDMMDRLLAILKDRPDYTAFLLDGQLIALEDYLAVCPHRREEIGDHVRSGRLSIGPWYVLPDEYLASGEAHIRNCMEGMRVAQGLGGGSKIGYLPDSFGHPGQMPQIISGLGMKEMVFWRGPGPEVSKAEFMWKGKDGSAILALNMAYGYSNAACLSEDEGARHARLDHEGGKVLDLSALGLGLLMNGTDHVAPDGRVPGWIARYAMARPELDVRMASLQAYIALAKERAAQCQLQQVSGELRSGYRAYLLGDTLSTRMPLKQRQQGVETLLESQLEPALAMLAVQGWLGYPRDKLRFAWRLALQNLPHDSICGCSIDPVHQEMLLRYRQVQDVGQHLKAGIAQALAAQGEDKAGFDGEVAVFNPLLGQVQTPVTVKLRRVLYPLRYVAYDEDQKLLEFTGDAQVPAPTGVTFYGPAGAVYHGRVVDVGLEDAIDTSLDTQPTMRRCQVITVTFAPTLPSLGYARLGYRWCFDPPQAQGLENDHCRVEAAQDGTLSVYDKAAQRWYHGLNRLWDRGDVGDEYTTDPIPGDEGIALDPATVKVRQAQGQLVISGELLLPVRVTPDRRSRSQDKVSCPVTVTATLYPHVPRVDIRTTVDNRAADHRLTARFPLGETALGCESDSIFCIEARQLVGETDSRAYAGWKEQPNNSFFMKHYACLQGERGAAAVFVRGLPQFEVVKGEGGHELALTLLRCVGWLSRCDLGSRDGNGGWTVEAPEAQEQGIHTFEYAFFPHSPALPPAERYRQAKLFANPPLALMVREGGAAPAWDQAFAEVDHPAVVCSAWKAAEDGQGYVLRLCNMGDEAVETQLSLLLPGVKGVQTASMDECPQTGCALLPIERGVRVGLVFRPWQVVTLLIRLG